MFRLDVMVSLTRQEDTTNVVSVVATIQRALLSKKLLKKLLIRMLIVSW